MGSYPDHVPVVIEKYETKSWFKSTPVAVPDDTPKPRFHKYLIPRVSIMSNLLACYRKDIKLPKDEAMWWFTESGVIIMPSMSVGEVYELHANKEDGFLYIKSNADSVLG